MRVRDDGDVVEQKAPTPPPVVPFNSLKVNDNLTLAVVAAHDLLPNLSIQIACLVFNEIDSFCTIHRKGWTLFNTSKEVLYNPKAEELFAPVVGPDCLSRSQQEKAQRNMLAGFVEEAHLSEFQFEAQRKTFAACGKFCLFILLHEYNYGMRCGVLIFVNYFCRLRIRSKHW